MSTPRKRIGIALAAALLISLLGGCAADEVVEPVVSETKPTDLCTEECTDFSLSVVGDGGEELVITYVYTDESTGFNYAEGEARNVDVPWTQDLPLSTDKLTADGVITFMVLANDSEGITCQINVNGVLVTEAQGQQNGNTRQAICIFLMSSLSLTE